MSRMHDVGGADGFGPIVEEPDEPPFHSDWEAHVFAMNRALVAGGVYNLDEFRDAVEQLPGYLTSSYYENWFNAMCALLVRKGVLSADEVDHVPGG
ncbi:nitrile hydratase subunit beta [Lentzea tibetensis]|uniref:Nitrile hydratase subunit beta n=1 Tax=Lentzea tibetensis TaxID=2591470 RepID=A0A563EL98_9PSEU|nr:SH3-like domain-containing protein [Lentzea tibetensis]TWP47525.1 nitrile hydratase subunit beta [Lentzea tibetensis]